MNSLCIPRAMTYTTVADVTRVFNRLFDADLVERVDEREMTDTRGQTFKIFYIHFLPGTTMEMENFKTKMEKDGMVQVMTGQKNWFWKVYLNKSQNTSKPARKGPRIMTVEDEQLFLQWKATKTQTVQEFTQEEVNLLEEALYTNEGFTEEELDELEDAQDPDDELMAIADEMAKE